MSQAHALRNLKSVLAGALLLLAISQTPAAHVGATSPLCFQHIGPQDKPMPEFCLVVSAATVREAPPRRSNVVVSAATRQRIVDTCATAAALPPDVPAGSYRVSMATAAAPVTCEVGPDAMRRVLDIVEADFGKRRQDLPDVLARLRLRLGAGR